MSQYYIKPEITLYLKGLPEGRSRKGLDTGNEPDLIEHSKNPLTKLVSHIVLDCGRGKQSIVDRQQEGQQGVPGLALHSLALLCQLLHSPGSKVVTFKMEIYRSV